MNNRNHVTSPAPAFYDERVEKEKGTIARNAMLIATCFALFSFLFRFANVLRYYPIHRPIWPKLLSILLCEGVILLSGVILLVVGLGMMLQRESDERTAAALSRYWQRAGKIQLLVSAVSVAITVPLSAYLYTNINYSEIDLLQVLSALALLLAIYLLWAYPARKVYFHEKAHATDSIWKAIAHITGRLALAMLTLLLLSLAANALLYTGPFAASERFLAISIACVIGYASLCLLAVAIFSLHIWLERLSYQKRRLLSPAVLVTLLLIILLRCAFAVAQINIVRLIPQMSMQLVLRSYFSVLATFADLCWLAFLSFYMEEYTRERPDRLVRVGVLLTFLAEGWGYALNVGLQHLVVSLHNTMTTNTAHFTGVFLLLSSCQQLIAYGISLAGMLTVTLLIAGLVRRKLISGLHFLLPVACLAFLGLDIFLSTQSATIFLRGILSEVVIALRTTYLLLLLFLVSRRQALSEQVKIPNNI